jgi:hypothetical protein
VEILVKSIGPRLIGPNDPLSGEAGDDFSTVFSGFTGPRGNG